MAPSYTLYGHPNTASTGIHWLLIHLEQTQGVKFDFKTIDIMVKKEQKEDAYISLNPKGRIPTLVAHTSEGDVTITETGAIALILADEHRAAKLSPPADAPLARRARFDEALIFVVNSILPALRDWMYADKDGSPEYAHGVRLLTLDRLKMMYGILDRQLGRHKYLAGDEPSAVDFVFCATMSWDQFVYELSRRFKNIKRFDDDMRSSESFKELAKREDLSFSGIKEWEQPYVQLSSQL